MSSEQLLIFLAQSSDTNADEIFTRILLAFCSIGLVWLALMGALIYRGIENRRRKAEGIEPLPPIWTWAYHLVLRVVNPAALPDSAKQRPKAATESTQPQAAARAPAWDPSMPAPDLDMLMGEFGAPEFDDLGAAQATPQSDDMSLDDDDDLSLDFDVAPEPASAIPAEPSGAQAAPDQAHDLSEAALADEFALDVDEEPAGVEDESVPEADAESEAESEDETEHEPESETAPEPEEEPVMAAPTPASSASPTADSPPDAVELLRVWRDISDGSLILEISGRRFTSLADLRSADLERRFINVVKELIKLAKSGGGAAPQSQVQPQPQAQPSPRPGAQPTPAKPDAEDTTDAKPARKLTTDEMPSMAPGDMFRQMGQIALGRKQEELEEEPMSEPLSIPEQIDALLQRRLRSLPEYAGREIEVQPSLGGLVIIKVDGKFYEGVGEVEDDDVRALLQDVVREWEESQ
jgi:hypothetical protein